MGKLVIMPVAVLVMLLFAGAAQAWTCAPGYKDCDGNWPLNACEVNINTDINNCGDCGYKCGSLCGANVVPACKSGKCEFSCKPPYLNCDYNWKNGCEVDSNKDVSNCGSCGNKCIAPAYATTTCASGTCQYSCKPGWKNCDSKWENGCETDVGQDIYNCGACGNKCIAPTNAYAKCAGGKCEYTCKPGYYNCDGDWSNGCERSCLSDVYNCGGCGVKCGYYPNTISSCYSGKCVFKCKPGFANCDGNWENGCETCPSIDANNCGQCGNKCPTPKYLGGEAKCTNGVCEKQSCKKGWSWERKKSCCVSSGNGGGKKCVFWVCW